MKKKMIPSKDRPTKPITIRMPVDVLEDLKRVAPTKALPGYQSLIKFYIRQGLRLDLERLWETEERTKKLDAVLNEIGLKKEQKSKIWEALGGNIRGRNRLRSNSLTTYPDQFSPSRTHRFCLKDLQYF